MIALLEEKRGRHAVDRTLLFAEKSCHASRSVLLRKERGRHVVDRALLFAEKSCHASGSVLLERRRAVMRWVVPFGTGKSMGSGRG